MDKDTRVAVITGAAGGIGRSTVDRFLQDGWSVVGVDLNAEGGEALLASRPDAVAAGRLGFIRADVSDEADVEAAFEYAAGFGHLGTVVSAAAVGGAFGSITDLSVQDWDRTMAMVLRSVFLCTKHGVRRFRQAGTGGQIVNVGSLAALVGDAGLQAYSVAKAGVVQLGRVLATELGPERIRVNTVAPGAVATPLNRLASTGFEGSELARQQPWPEAGQPEDLAEVIFFLGSDASRFITGEVIVADGGLYAAGPRIGAAMGTSARSGMVTGFNEGTTGVRSRVDR